MTLLAVAAWCKDMCYTQWSFMLAHSLQQPENSAVQTFAQRRVMHASTHNDAIYTVAPSKTLHTMQHLGHITQPAGTETTTVILR